MARIWGGGVSAILEHLSHLFTSLNGTILQYNQRDKMLPVAENPTAKALWSISWQQWAAVRMYDSERMDPPHKAVLLPILIDTLAWYGQEVTGTPLMMRECPQGPICPASFDSIQPPCTHMMQMMQGFLTR